MSERKEQSEVTSLTHVISRVTGTQPRVLDDSGLANASFPYLICFFGLISFTSFTQPANAHKMSERNKGRKISLSGSQSEATVFPVERFALASINDRKE